MEDVGVTKITQVGLGRKIEDSSPTCFSQSNSYQSLTRGRSLKSTKVIFSLLEKFWARK
jgi:hypothetical protein